MPGFPEGALELSVTAARSPDVPGAVVHRKALLPPDHVAHVDNIPVTTAARTLFDLAVLPLPERELDVGDASTWVGRVEFVYRQARLLVEIDSRRHHSSLLDLEADKARDNRLMAAGWRVLRVSDLMLRERPEAVTNLVRNALAAR